MPYVNVEATGLNLKNLFKANNLKVKDVQAVFGFANPQAVYNWLSGKSLPTVDNLVILSALLHTTLDALVVIDTTIAA